MDSIEKLLLTKVIKPINTVYETEEYSLFGDCPFNRDVFPDHLQKIMFPNQNRLRLLIQV